MRRLWRVLVFFAAFLCVVMPAWSAVRTIAAACASASASTSGGARAAPAPTLDEEETPEIAELRRHSIGLRRGADRRDEPFAAAAVALRHRTEHESARIARRWASYRAPPRAPPHRLLN